LQGKQRLGSRWSFRACYRWCSRPDRELG
jgi:hypothetical protein